MCKLFDSCKARARWLCDYFFILCDYESVALFFTPLMEYVRFGAIINLDKNCK